MSCYFQVGEEDLWNPSNSVARVFLGQADVLSRLVGQDSGLGPIVEDECELEFSTFVNFVDSLVKTYQDSNNRALRSLIGGFISVAMVLVERGGGELQSISSEYADMWAEVRETHARSMPTG